MPKEEWTGYGRFCPLARGLDIVGERWMLVILQELHSSPKRFSDLHQRLPGIGSTVLTKRLRKLVAWGLAERVPGGVGEPVVYTATGAGRELEPAMSGFREWGVRYLLKPDPAPVGMPREISREASYDVSYVRGIEKLSEEEYEWRIGSEVVTLSFVDSTLVQRSGPASAPAVVLRTSPEFMRRWASGEVDWDAGRREGSVVVRGGEAAWRRMQAATGYLLDYAPA